jgi:hypothetical protein
MAFRNKGKTAEPQSILKNRTASSPDKLTPDQGIQLAGLVAAAVRNQNACYIQPGKYGSVMVKFYIEGDQFAENLVLNDELEEVCEQIVETLYTQDDVAWNRRTFGTARVQPVAKGRKDAQGGEDTGK